MSLILPDVVVEAVIRDGIGIIRDNLAVKRIDNQIVVSGQFDSTAGNSITELADVNNITITLVDYEVTPETSYAPDAALNEQIVINRTDDTDNFYALIAGTNINFEFELFRQPDADGSTYTPVNLTLNADSITAVNVTGGVAITFTNPGGIVSSVERTNINAILVSMNVGDYFIFLDLPGNQIVRPATDRLFDMIFNFNSLNALAGISGKYASEGERLRSILAKDDIAVVHSFNEVPARLPCISIQLASDDEDERIALNTDFGGVVTATGADFGRDENVVHANYSLMIGCHTKEPLLTKYLYTLVKYFLLDRKIFLEQNGLIVPSYRGSDFKRNLDYGGDQVYTRFLTMTGKTIDTWLNIDEVVANITSLSVNTFVGKDRNDIGNANILVSNFGFQTNLFNTDTPQLEITDPTYLTPFMNQDRTFAFRFSIQNPGGQGANSSFVRAVDINNNPVTATIIVTLSDNSVINIPILFTDPQNILIEDARDFIVSTINAADNRILATAVTTNNSIRRFDIEGQNGNIIESINGSADTSIVKWLIEEGEVDLQNRFTLARLQRNPANPLETMYVNNDVRIIDMETSETTGRTLLNLVPGTVSGPWMPGSYIVANTEGVQRVTTNTEIITLTPVVTFGTVGNVIDDNRVARQLQFLSVDTATFESGDVISFTDASTGNIETATVIGINSFSVTITDLPSTGINTSDEIFQIERLASTMGQNPGNTFKTRPDTISLGGSVTRVLGTNVQTISTGGTETYTDNSDSTNNNPSPVD